MSQNKLILRKLNSGYAGQFLDSTKGSVLSHSELDANQIYLKGELIYTATTSGTTLIFPQIKGDDIQVDIDELISGASSTISGTSFDSGTFILTLDKNDGTSFTENLSALASDIFVLGGVYNPTDGTLDFTTNSGVTFSVSGFTTGMTNYYTTGATFSDDTIYFHRTDSTSAYTADISAIGQTGSTLVPLIFNQALVIPNTSIQPSFGNNTLTTGATFSSILGGSGNTIDTDAHVSIIIGGFDNTINHQFGGMGIDFQGSLISHGSGNTISGQYNTILGGVGNQTASLNNTIIGGTNNTSINGGSNVILGGSGNVNGGSNSIVAGGSNNQAVPGGGGGQNHGTFVGHDNQVLSDDAVILGGNNHGISTSASNSFILGGNNSSIYRSQNSGILGGYNNHLTGFTSNAFIIGTNITATEGNRTYVSQLNIDLLPASGITTTEDNLLVRATDGNIMIRGAETLLSGSSFTASTPYEFTTGTTLGSIQPSDLRGVSNYGSWSTVGGGQGNTINKGSDFDFIGAGSGNQINAPDFSFIGGGTGNIMAGNNDNLVIGGGIGNRINGSRVDSSFIGGGSGNTINYFSTSANGNPSVIGGGKGNHIRGWDGGHVIVGGADNYIVSATSSVIISSAFNIYSLDPEAPFPGKVFDLEKNWTNNGNYMGPYGGFSLIGQGSSNWIEYGYGNFIGIGRGNVIGGLGIQKGFGDIVISNYTSRTIPKHTYWTGYNFIGSGIQNYTLNSSYAGIGVGAGNTHLFSINSNIGSGIRNNVYYSSYAVIGGGEGNVIASSTADTVTSGIYPNNFSFIGNGKFNRIVGESIGSAIVNGYTSFDFSADNYANKIKDSNSSFIGSGSGNLIDGTGAHVIVGGYSNQISATTASTYYANSIGGGTGNQMIGNMEYSRIGGGESNTIEEDASRSFIGGGSNNVIASGVTTTGMLGLNWFFLGADRYGYFGHTALTKTVSHSVIAGGTKNTNGGSHSVIGGGSGNTITPYGGAAVLKDYTGGSYGGQSADSVNSLGVVIGGGMNNTMGTWSWFSTIGGGRGNYIWGYFPTIAGGYNNSISNGKYSFIGGGSGNTIGGHGAVIGGGSGNIVNSSASYSSILGGNNNEIFGNSNFSAILGGRNNEISGAGDNIFIIGSNITGTTANTTYVEKLNLGTALLTANTVNTLLIRDTDGSVKARSVDSLPGAVQTDIPFQYDVSAGNTAILPRNNLLNVVDAVNSTVAGGGSNEIANSVTYYGTPLVTTDFTNNFIGAGTGNKIYSKGNTSHTGPKQQLRNNSILGGTGNKIDSYRFRMRANEVNYNAILGGKGNNISQFTYGEYYLNLAVSQKNKLRYNIIGGGQNNIISGSTGQNWYGGSVTLEHSIIGGGSGNEILGKSELTNAYSGAFNAYIYQASILSGKDNRIRTTLDTSNQPLIVGGNNNYIYNSSFSSILGGSGNTISAITNTHIIGSNITAVSANTTYVEGFNIGTVVTGNSVTDILVRDTDGTVKVRESTSLLVGGFIGKFITGTTFTGSVTKTITHGLGEEHVQVQLKDSTGALIIPDVVNNYTTTEVDIEVSITGTYTVIIIG